MRRSPPWVMLFLTLLVLAFFLVRPVVNYYADWLWFNALGFEQVFLIDLKAQLLLGVAGFVLAFLLLYGNVFLALKSLSGPIVFPAIGGKDPFGVRGESFGVVVDAPVEEPPSISLVHLRRVLFTVLSLSALLAGAFAARHGIDWLRLVHATPFGDVDPILGWDVSFYVFRLPFLVVARGFLMILLVLGLIGSMTLYMMEGAISLNRRSGFWMSGRVRTHLSLLVAGLLLLVAFGAFLEIPGLLVTPAGVVFGASYVDVQIRLWALRVIAAVSVLGALLAIYNLFTTRNWPIPVAVAAYFLVSLTGDGVAGLVQRFVVSPNEQVKELPYIRNNIAATRKAFDLEDVEELELSGDAKLTREDIDNNQETLKNVRLWDHQPLLDTFGQIQEIRTYYDFVSVDNDRYVINGEYRQIMLSARELNPESLPSRTWINERLVFTHGYGLTLGPVNQVTPEGLPVLFIKNLPPESSVDLEVKEPAIYFGELSSDHVFVKTNAREFHYPKGDDNVFTSYAEDAGVAMDGFFRKLLFSVRFGSLKVLLSDDITSESRVLFHRNIGERVKTIAPFLHYDDDPYLVISAGRLYWITDAYTTSGLYPYSSPGPEGINYIRNAFKVVIDACTGKTTFYLADPEDAMGITYTRIFPDLFKPLETIPEGLRRHLRYPEHIFSLQTQMYQDFHMTNPEVFYNKEDRWEAPKADAGVDGSAMEPYFTIMKLPNASSAEFIQMLPFTPQRKENLAAWMVARSDGEHYGKLLVFRFPKQKVVFGPSQVVARINQDQVISPQITLWNQQGSEVIMGTLLVIPIEESLLYVRPLYLRASGGKIPELKRVIVAYQARIVMEETLEEALDRIFPRKVREQPVVGAEEEKASGVSEDEHGLTPPQPAGPEHLVEIAQAHYAKAVQAQREGDWARYGEELRKLGEVLEKMGHRTEKKREHGTDDERAK